VATGERPRDAEAVQGEVAAGFGPVRGAVQRVLDDHGGGVAVAAFLRGEPVVDLWGGTVGRDGLVHTWSSIKPVVATTALLLAARGRLDLGAPVARVWPAFAAAGKADVPVAWLLDHRAGLAPVPPPGTAASLLDWEASCAALAAAAPAWPPGSAPGEHALTYGHLVGEVVRRADGRSVGALLAEEVAAPLGLDLHVGLSPGDQARVADLEGVTPAWWAGRAPPGCLRARALGTGMDADLVNGAAWRAGEVPAVNGHATARALAGFWAAVLDGRLPADILRPSATGVDLFLEETVTWTRGGAQVDGDDIGMGGAGGSWAAARPALGLAWAFLPTVMGSHDRAGAVEKALLRCVAAR